VLPPALNMFKFNFYNPDENAKTDGNAVSDGTTKGL
jgi:hypothetical protein